MNCEDFKKELKKVDNGDALPSLSSMIDHFETCSSCKLEFSDRMEELNILSQLKEIAVPDPGEEFWNTFSQKVRTQIAQENIAPPPARKWSPLWSYSFLTAAAMILLVIFLLPFFQPRIPNIDLADTGNLADSVIEIFSEESEFSDIENIPTEKLSNLLSNLLLASINENGFSDSSEDLADNDENWTQDLANFSIEDLSQEQYQNLLNQLERLTL